MTDFTRLTIVGSRRKAEMVVPNDEAVGALIPRLMELLDERAGTVSRPLTLVRSSGEQLDTARTPAEQNVYDGELLRLLREDAAPPPPEVADVTDVLAESHDERAGLWNTGSRRATALVAVAAAAAASGTLAERLPGLAGPLLPLAVYVLAAAVAVVGGRGHARWLGLAATALGVGVSLPLATAALPFLPGAPDLLRLAALVLALVWAMLALGEGAGAGSRGAWWGGVIGAVLPASLLVLLGMGVPALGAAGVVAVVAAVICGLLPWYAMSASGLTGLDDQVVEGRLRRRDAVLHTVDGAYRTLSWATAAVAAPLALTTIPLLASRDGWAIGLGAAALVVTAARTRTMPLAGQGFALWAAAGIGGIGGLLLSSLASPAVTAGILALLALVAILAGGVSPAAHQRASLRRLGNAIEAIGVAAMLPLLLGVFGVYADLLGAFS